MSTTHTIQTERSNGLIRGTDLAVKVLIRLSIFLGAAAALGMVINVFLDVVMRFGMNTPIQGTNQFVSYWWMLPLVFFGLAAAQHYGEHTDLPIVYERWTPVGSRSWPSSHCASPESSLSSSAGPAWATPWSRWPSVNTTPPPV